MFSSILGALTGAFKAIGSVMGFLEDKNKENLIRKGYEEEKRADTLEEDKVSLEKLEKSKNQVKETRDSVRAVSAADIKDAELTDVEVEEELKDIEDEDEQTKREREIKAAQILKKRKTVTQNKIENNDSFNNGDTISFGG